MKMETPLSEFRTEYFKISTLADELRVDQLCRTLLQDFYIHLQQEQGLAPEKASELAYCADYYLRDYLVDALRQNVLTPRKGQVRYFAGTWYCSKTMEPEVVTLERHLEAISGFYAFMAGLGLVSSDHLSLIREELDDQEFYRERVARFKNISGEGYMEWLMECPHDLVSNGDIDA